MSAVQVVVRRARAGDEAARGALLRRSLQHAYAQTCLYFFCQELTLEGCVLGGAVLFIFAGAAPVACAAVLPTAALLVALAVRLAHRGLADTQLRALRGEAAGWVAEAARRPGPADPTPGSRGQVVGTVSVSRHARAARRGWLHALHVAPGWRRRGVARALVAAARREAATRGLRALEALASDLQPAARACLHAAGWTLAGTYERRVLGAAVTLPLALLQLDLAPPC